MNRNRREIKIVSAKFVSHGLNSKHEETSSFMSNGKKSDRNELSRSILSHRFFNNIRFSRLENYIFFLSPFSSFSKMMLAHREYYYLPGCNNIG